MTELPSPYYRSRSEFEKPYKWARRVGHLAKEVEEVLGLETDEAIGRGVRGSREECTPIEAVAASSERLSEEAVRGVATALETPLQQIHRYLHEEDRPEAAAKRYRKTASTEEGITGLVKALAKIFSGRVQVSGQVQKEIGALSEALLQEVENASPGHVDWSETETTLEKTMGEVKKKKAGHLSGGHIVYQRQKHVQPIYVEGAEDGEQAVEKARRGKGIAIGRPTLDRPLTNEDHRVSRIENGTREDIGFQSASS